MSKKLKINLQITILFVPLHSLQKGNNIGELAEWSNAAVLKTVDLNGSGGSNPSLSAKHNEKSRQACLNAIFLLCFASPRRRRGGMCERSEQIPPSPHKKRQPSGCLLHISDNRTYSTITFHPNGSSISALWIALM